MTSEGNNLVMPVSPMYGGYGNGGGFGNWGSDIWIILLVLFALGGFGGWGMGGMGMGMMGGFGGMYEFPWILASNANNQNATQGGFNQLATNNAINALQASVNSGFGDVNLGIAGINQNICQTGNSIVSAVNGGFSQAEVANNARQMANMQQAFANQTAMNQGFNGLQGQLAQCCCDNRLATAQLGSDIARESCATRTSDTQNTQAVLTAINGGFQSLKDQMYQDKLDAKNDIIAQLRQEALYARGQASQDVQTARLEASNVATVDALYNRLATCPVGTMPVYGNQPIFTCPQSYTPNNCGCGCNGNF